MFTTQLKSFFTVARTGSFTQAARQLGISQPTVTAQIKALEAHYGVELFYRGGRRLELTEVGASLMPKALDLLSREIEIDFLLRNSSAMEGNLRIGVTAPYFLMPIVNQLCQKHPKVGVSMTMGNSAQVLTALDEYRVDVAASAHYLNDSRLLRLELAKTPIVLVVHRTHRLARRDAVPLAALAEERLLLREEGSITRALTENMLKEGGVQPASSLEIGSREMIREAVLLNMGVSTVGLQEVPNHPDLRVLHFADAEAMLAEYLYCLSDRREGRLIQAFMTEARLIYSV
jgi:LysR family transcriptional regulator, low CO2-responsive transcriptional regulator